MPSAALAWGAAGHAIVTHAALVASEELPRWFRESGGALLELSSLPDRWRSAVASVPALAARNPDHFFALDDWGAGPMPPDRWEYADRARRRRLRPEVIGFLPYAILEEYGALLSAFRDVRARRGGGREAALVSAGVLAHLVADAAVPLHVTRHHHGWVGPNPREFARGPGVHEWFETELVRSVKPATVRASAPRGALDVQVAVRAILAESLAAVSDLYEAERTSRRNPPDPTAGALVRDRLRAGADLLAHLWQSAWTASRRSP